MAAGKRCAVLAVGSLVELWGAEVEVRRSQVEGKRYPLYLSTKTGPVPFNTPTAQEFLLNFADFDGAPKEGALISESAANDPEFQQEAMPAAANDEEMGDIEQKKRSFVEWLGALGDG